MMRKNYWIYISCLLGLFLFVSKGNADQTDVENFVSRFYEECLSRTPDPTGLDGWVNALLRGELTGADLAESFIFSKEFSSLNSSNEEYVTILYNAFFNRAPDPSGYNGWLNALYGGVSRENILSSFTGSSEFATLCQNYGITPQKEGTPVEQFVTRFYNECLNRSPDQSGLDGWVAALQNAVLTGADLAEAFILSKEFINREYSPEAYVTILYKAFFNRNPDISGYNGWLNALYGGMSRMEVLNAFTSSKEFASLCTQYGIVPTAAEDTSLTGTWLGNWYSYYSDVGRLTIRINQSGSSLSGTFDITNTDCGNINNINFTGTVSGDIVDIYATHNCSGEFITLEYTNGVISNNGSSINGYYTVYVSGDYWDSGTFYIGLQ